MSKKDVIEVKGIVVDALLNTIFKVRLENGHKITAHIRAASGVNIPPRSCAGPAA